MMGIEVYSVFGSPAVLLTQIGQDLLRAAEKEDVLKVSLIVLLSAAVLALLAREQRSYIRTALAMFIGAVFLMFAAPVAAAAARARMMQHHQESFFDRMYEIFGLDTKTTPPQEEPH